MNISTLGGLSIRLPGQPDDTLIPQKVQALLVYLACTRRTHSREVLAELLWVDRTQAQSLANLRTVLTQVRRQIGPYVLISRNEIGLDPASGYRLDVDALEQRLAVADALPATERLSAEALQALEAAVELYRGDFLEGFYVDSQAFEDWALLERERLRFRAMEALDRLVAEYLERGAYAAGITHTTRLLQMDALREKTHRQLMQLLAESGQRSAALNQYENCRHLLREELDIEPAPETVALQERILVGLTGEARLPARPVPMQLNPYKGLRAFQEADAPDFFGREALVGRLVGRLAGDEPWARFLAVVGPSGCGKSSVVRAGLVPALRAGALPGSECWRFVTLMPGAHPLDELAVALRRALPLGEVDVLGELARDERGLLRLVKQALPEDARVELVLVVDQFEEVFSLVAEEGTQRYLLDGLLETLSDAHSRMRIIVSLRADFYDRPLLHPGLGEWVRQCTEVVLPLTAEELQRAIVSPAERVGVQVEPALVTAVVADVTAQPGALPLLQYALTELFEHRDGERVTLAAYRAGGGVRGALAARADALYAAMSPVEQAAAQQVFLRLVQLGEGTEDTRRRAAWAEVAAIAGGDEPAHAVVDRFVKHRLLTLDHDPATGSRTVELAHEALIREWGRLRGWIDEGRADLRQQRLLSASAAEWRAAGEERSYLLSGSKLAQFEDWAASTRVALTPEERRHLEASLAEHQRQRARRRRTRNAVLTVAISVAILMTLLSLIALDRERRAQQARTRAEREAVVNHSILLGNQAQDAQAAGYTDLALILALEAAKIDEPPPDIIGVLADIAFGAGTRYVIQAHPYRVTDVAISPDERLGLSASCQTMVEDACVEGALTLWDLETGKEVRRLQGHTGWVNGVAFSPDGLTALSASGDASLVLWDVSTGAVVRRLEGHTEGVNSVVFSPDGLQALSGSTDRSMILWDVASGTAIRRFSGQAGAVNAVAFSPDGLQALSGSNDGTLILWDAESGRVVRRFAEHTDAVNGVAFSPEGSIIFSGDQGSWLRVYDARTGAENRGRPHTYGQAETDISIGPTGQVAVSTIGSCLLYDIASNTDLNRYGGDYLVNIWTAAISNSGQAVLVGTTDGRLGLMNVENEAELRRFGIGIASFALAISPDERTLLSGTVAQQNAEATLWDLASGTEIRHLTVSGSTSVFDATFSPDGRYAYVAVSSMMGDPEAPSRVIMWDVATGEEIRRFDESIPGWLIGVAISPDGRRLLTSSASMAQDRLQGGLILWDAESGRALRQFTTQNTGAVAFSADGRRALSGTYWGADGSVSLWDVATGQEIRRFSGGHKTGDAAFGVAFGPGETTVISGSSDSTLVVWDLETGKVLRRFVGSDGAIWSQIRLSRDGRYVLSASFGDVLLWDFATGGIVRHYRGYTNWGNVVFGPDEETALSASGSSSDGIIEWKIADMPLGDLIAWTHVHRYARDFTCDERAQYRIEPLCE